MVIIEAAVAIVVMPTTAVEEEHVKMVAMTETAVAVEEQHIKSVAVTTTALDEEHVTMMAIREPAIAVVEKHMKSLAMTDTAVAVEEQHASNVAVTTTAVAVKGTHGKWRVWTRAANSVKRQACRAKMVPKRFAKRVARIPQLSERLSGRHRLVGGCSCGHGGTRRR